MSVSGTGTLVYPEAFLGIPFERSPRDFSFRSPCGTRTFSTSPFSWNASLPVKCRWCWNINQLDIVYALRPQLSPRLTLGGRTFPRKPWVYGGPDFHRPYRYSCLHSHFQKLHARLPSRFTVFGTLLYRVIKTPAASVCNFIANHFRREISR